ncbi:tyrosine-type recombinase/integrase [Butyrivibrio sp. INlla14]|uniref:tyrosine-type recombinase/integrase n=1 Tax=Butyrivibrio sp. INlla14 TaxID=1520808 RepID=UPI0008768453|nr:tyrosine-type recombinase/integrase [Butyrivibrio sp. INlla14]SCY75662.1 Phage integrase family protein [Butyrivibrio sp. INlla14]
MKEGMLYIKNEYWILFLLILSGVVNFFLAGYNLLLPFTENLFTNVVGFYGKAMMSEALGGIVGAFLCSKLKIQENIRTMIASDIIMDGGRYRLNITEKKTLKKRTFTVPVAIYNYMRVYAADNNIEETGQLFPIGERAVQKYLAKVCDYLGYKNIGTHSFRKFFATEIYLNNDYNIVLVQQLLQHSSVAVTQKYIGITSEMQEKALEEHIALV